MVKYASWRIRWIKMIPLAVVLYQIQKCLVSAFGVLAIYEPPPILSIKVIDNRIKFITINSTIFHRIICSINSTRSSSSTYIGYFIMHIIVYCTKLFAEVISSLIILDKTLSASSSSSLWLVVLSSTIVLTITSLLWLNLHLSP